MVVVSVVVLFVVASTVAGELTLGMVVAPGTEAEVADDADRQQDGHECQDGVQADHVRQDLRHELRHLGGEDSHRAVDDVDRQEQEDGADGLSLEDVADALVVAGEPDSEPVVNDHVKGSAHGRLRGARITGG